MIRFYFTLSILLVSFLSVATPGDDVPRKNSVTSSYPAVQQTGLIGITEASPVDNPADNIFHVPIGTAPCSEDKVWLVYELNGVKDHNAVSRSINDQLSVGGYFVSRGNAWTTQREQVNASWLKQGDNIVRFTTPENASYHYSVRNLRFEITSSEENTGAIELNQTSGIYYAGKAYIKGFISGAGSESARIRIGSQYIRIFQGEFEAILDLQYLDNACTVEAEVTDASGKSICAQVRFDQPVTPDVAYTFTPFSYHAEKIIDGSINDELSLQGARVITAKGSVASPLLLSITSLTDRDIPALDAGMVNVTRDHDGFRFLPHGTHFGNDVDVRIPFDEEKIPDGYTEEDIRTFYFDEQSHHWVPLKLDTVLTGEKEVVSTTSHFTDMINAVIKVPESPEVEAYNSTSMKGIKAANPTAAVNLINPPQANNTGSASLSYPISMPAGRAGMQPQLAISYNSGGGNGWLGLGWNLVVPSISIDTRWGVPRYDPDYETETYSFSGEQLTPVAHTGALQKRYADGKQFYPRVEGGFQKIIRHGNSPATYWWEITDKSGTKYSYGGSAGSFDERAVLRTGEEDDGGNVAEWHLREVRDLNGNTINYHYVKVADVGVAGGSVKGYQIYVDKITYTGYQGGDGPFVIQFTRESSRLDKVIAGNLGFKQVTGDRLQKISVLYTGGNSSKPIRSYELKYKNGAFYKSLLTSITEYDAANQPFTTHTFDYYDDVNAASSYKPFLTQQVTNTFSENINGGFLNKGQFNDKASALSGTYSSTLGGGLAVTVGVNDERLAIKSLTAGISYSYTHSKSEGRVLMLDVNGDGLSDKVVMLKDGTNKVLKYHPQILSKNGTVQFSAELRPINGVNEFLKETSSAHDFGVESSFGVFAGLNYSLTKSQTSVYFTDANGDGLIDIVNNGKVLFNRLNDQGDPTFSDDSRGTPNEIVPKGSLDGELITVNPDEVALLKERNPLEDMVRMWRAPFDGTVSVTAPVALLEDKSEERKSYATADGVNVSIQLKGAAPLWSQAIGANDYSQKTPALTNLVVKKGDRIYFRVQSVEDGAYDQVSWKPVIQYAEHKDTIRDANNKAVYQFNAYEDFLLSTQSGYGMPISGKVNIESTFIKPVLSDSVTVEIVRTSGSSATVLFKKKFDDQIKANEPIALSGIAISEGDKLEFKVTASSNVSWNKIDWKPLIYYTEAQDANAIPVKDENNNYLIKIRPVSHHSLYPEVLTKTLAWRASNDDSIRVKPLLDFLQFINVGKQQVSFTIKKQDSLVSKQIINVTDTLITSTLTDAKVRVKKGDKLFFEFHTTSYKLATDLAKALAVVTFSNGSTQQVKAGLYTVLTDDNIIFGPLDRGWGMFAYNDNGTNGTSPIDESKLNADKIKSTPSVDLSNATTEDEMNNTFSSSGGYRADQEPFVLMYAEGNKQRWMGNDDFTYINLDTLSSSRMGLDQISALFPEFAQGAGTAFAVDKITKSNQTSLALSGGAGGVNVGANGSTGNSRVITDYMDMNGDRYPDILGQFRIQYTLPGGGLEDKSKPHDWEFGHYTSLLAGGVSAGGGFTKSGKETSTAPRKSAFSSIGEATSVNVSSLWSKDEASYSWLDINGDGLPDRVNADNGKVSLNLGYSFAPEESWGSFEVRKGSSESMSGGIGVNIKNHSIQAGVSYSKSDNTLKETLQDVNGDGLPDKVTIGSGVSVLFNTGNGFASTAVTWGQIQDLDKGSSTSWSANGAFTIGIPLVPPVPVVKLCINPKVFYSQGFNRQNIQLSDIDGDGYPDYLSSQDDGTLNVATSTIGRTNLLKSVQRPLGASFTLAYERLGNTYALPHSTWVVDTVIVYDGFANDGVDKMMTTFSYEDGVYDRRERESYGFGKVITRSHDTGKDGNPVYTIVTQSFSNGNYYEKGLLLSEVMTDGNGKKFAEKTNTYKFKDINNGADLPASALSDLHGNAFPALVASHQNFYEGKDTAGKTTGTTFSYDTKGNVVSYTDLGDEGNDDDLNASITYYNIPAKYIMGTPKSITVTGSGITYRKREAVIDENTGDITQIKQYLGDSEIATYDMEYDSYGSLKKIARPKNAKDQRLSIEYEYDNEVHSYVTKISDSYGYSSQAMYDVRYGQLLQSTDLNGNQINYEVDNLGRIISITGPYEKGGTKTIEFIYHPEAAVPWALTKHYDPSNPKNTLNTVIFVDGLGRVLQTKKDIALYTGDGKADAEMMAVSGRVYFDAFGRTTTAYYPVTTSADPASWGTFFDTKDTVKPSVSTYDVLNRTLTVTLPDDAITKTEYDFGQDKFGLQQFSKKTIDANGKQTEQFTDVRGRVTSVKNYTSDKLVWTSFRYNAINEQVEATDDLGNTTSSSYDNLGRRISRKHPDAGTTSYSYDLAGNLKELITANLQKEGQAIQYTYDFERLTNITYPENPENNVKYTYGAAGASDNRVGRIVLQEDATGAQEFFYGPLGEIVKNVRTIVLPKFDDQTYITEWKYDTWNRLTSMTYADGEEITYTYNQGGLLRGMNGKKKNASFNYVNQVGYDKFEQRVLLAYGNGTKTTYNYEADRRRLKNMTAKTAANRLFMDNTYTYDKVNNILDLKNNAPIPSPNLMGGSSDYSYEYDDLYRLTKAQGTFKGPNDTQTYTLAMDYNSVGGIVHKNQNHQRKGTVQKKTTYDLLYTYGTDQPHAPTHIGDQTYTYDANGNQAGWTDDKTGQERKIMWDEENRIRSIYDNGAQHHYIYDAAGERVVKAKSIGQRVFVNGEWKAGSGNMGNYIVYVNPYIVLKSGGYTKHYYVGGQRIVSKLGGGWDNNGKGPLKAGGSNVDYATKSQKLFDGIVKNLKFLGADGQILTAGKSGKIPPGQIKGTANIAESFRYFYHPDHLGSTSYVTDASGEVFQHMQYFAFGETFVEEHSNTDRIPYLFNGKELDEETGLYYYGARYYDPRTSLFQAIDRYAEKYPSLSAYSYAANNPLTYIDPSGDTIVVNKFGDITRNDKTDNLVYMSGKDGKLTSLGQLGGKIDINTIYANLLEKNADEAHDIWDPRTFRDKVKNKGDWDYKNRTNTIYGLANHTKGKSTTFLFDGKQMTAEDLGNHHFGVVGKAYGFFSEEFMLQKAGEAQIQAGTSKPEWQKYEEKTYYGSKVPYTVRVPLPPYGDDPNDQYWIKQGFDYYKRKL